MEKILAAKGSTDIPVCAGAAKDPQTGMSVPQWERELDELVYALYGLTPEEIKIVKGSAK